MKKKNPPPSWINRVGKLVINNNRVLLDDHRLPVVYSIGFLKTTVVKKRTLHQCDVVVLFDIIIGPSRTSSLLCWKHGERERRDSAKQRQSKYYWKAGAALKGCQKIIFESKRLHSNVAVAARTKGLSVRQFNNNNIDNRDRHSSNNILALVFVVMWLECGYLFPPVQLVREIIYRHNLND